MERIPLSQELHRELLLQINDELAAEGYITQEMCQQAKEKILKMKWDSTTNT